MTYWPMLAAGATTVGTVLASIRLLEALGGQSATLAVGAIAIALAVAAGTTTALAGLLVADRRVRA